MKIGEVSKPIKKQNTVNFLKLANKKISKAGEINYEELKKKPSESTQKNELFNLYSKSYISKIKNTT